MTNQELFDQKVERFLKKQMSPDEDALLRKNYPLTLKNWLEQKFWHWLLKR